MSQLEKPIPRQDYVKSQYPQSEVTGRIIAAALDVHNYLGPGFREVIYQRALELEFPVQGLEFSREVWIDVNYRNRKIGSKRVDFIVQGVLLEIKAKSQIEDVDVIQSLSYLKASGYGVGLLLNFGSGKLGIKRLIHTVEKEN